MTEINVNEALHRLYAVQRRKMSYEEFCKIIRRRVRRWTGKSAAAFYTDAELVAELIRLNILDDEGLVR